MILRPQTCHSFNFRANFRFSKFSTSWTNPMVCSGGASANSFSDLTTPNRSQKPSAQAKIPDCPNEFVGLENFEVEGAAGPKSRHAIRPANPPAGGITLETNTSSPVRVLHWKGTLGGNTPPALRPSVVNTPRAQQRDTAA